MDECVEVNRLVKDMFSVIIPAFKCRQVLLRAVNSVLSQNYDKLEVIVIDDGCPDRSFEVLSDIKDSRIIVLHLLDNEGAYFARNIGVNSARGQYVAFLDADDYWHDPCKLSKQKECFDNGERVVFSEYYRAINDEVVKHVKVPVSVTYTKLLKGNVIGNLTGCYDAISLGKFYQKKVGHEDYLMWLNIVKCAGLAVSIQEPLATYSVSSYSLSSNKFKSAAWQWNIYRDRLNFGFLKSLTLFSFYIFNSLAKRL